MLTLTEIISQKPMIIYHSVHTVWWTHDPKDLKKGPIPMDPFGSPLWQTSNVSGYLNQAAISMHPLYGHNRVRNFLLAHAKNMPQVIELLDTHGISKRDRLKYVRDWETFVTFLDQHFHNKMP